MASLVYDYSSLDNFLSSQPYYQELLIALVDARHCLLLGAENRGLGKTLSQSQLLGQLEAELEKLFYS